jgi:carboxylesterase
VDMTQRYLPGSDPVSIDGGPVGVVLSHGFTGTPASMRPWAEHLGAAGYTVRLPRLPGHGTTWQHMNGTTWQEWYAEVEAAYAELSSRCARVFAGGLSMGGSLVTLLAENHPELAGLILVNPAYATRRFDARFARYLTWAIRSKTGIGSDIKAGGVENGYGRTPVRAFVSMQGLWRTTVARLGEVLAPIRLYTSRVDHVVDDLSALILRRGATNTVIDQVWLENSYHVATLDYDAQLIFDGSVDFISSHTTVTG